ncbi:MAG: hypothetical protein WD334_12385, partial [Chitinophagales bacterium]
LLLPAILTSSCKKETCYDCRAYNYLSGDELDAEQLCGDTDRNNYYKAWNKAERNWTAECTPR